MFVLAKEENPSSVGSQNQQLIWLLSRLHFLMKKMMSCKPLFFNGNTRYNNTDLRNNHQHYDTQDLQTSPWSSITWYLQKRDDKFRWASSRISGKCRPVKMIHNRCLCFQLQLQARNAISGVASRNDKWKHGESVKSLISVDRSQVHRQGSSGWIWETRHWAQLSR